MTQEKIISAYLKGRLDKFGTKKEIIKDLKLLLKQERDKMFEEDIWIEGYKQGAFEIKKKVLNEEIKNINKFLDRLRGYSCGCHKQLEKQMLNRIKQLPEVKNE